MTRDDATVLDMPRAARWEGVAPREDQQGQR